MGGRRDFPTNPFRDGGPLWETKDHTTHSSHQPHLRVIRIGFLQNPNYILLSENLLWLKSEATPIPSGESAGL